MSKIEPIRPEQVVEAKKESLPEAVFDVFNKLIAANWDGRSSTFKQKEASEMIMKKMKGLTAQDVIDRGYLDIEDIFRAVGWEVIYDRPACNETYPPTFEFRKKSG